MFGKAWQCPNCGNAHVSCTGPYCSIDCEEESVNRTKEIECKIDEEVARANARKLPKMYALRNRKTGEYSQLGRHIGVPANHSNRIGLARRDNLQKSLDKAIILSEQRTKIAKERGTEPYTKGLDFLRDLEVVEFELTEKKGK